MVRLKVHSKINANEVFEFQFHYGTIKSTIIKLQPKVFILFQFHYGTIKRIQFHNGAKPFNEFQFHYGTIKRELGFLIQIEGI